MKTKLNLDHEFTYWFNQVENFGLKSERFFDEITHKPSKGYDWMKEAFIAGAKAATGISTADKKIPALLIRKK
jgi:hypothetical protein